MNLHARVVALERRREERQGGSRYGAEVEAELRRLRRCEQTGQAFEGALARCVEAIAPGTP